MGELFLSLFVVVVRHTSFVSRKSFTITTAPFLFKLGMIHLWDKEGIDYESQVPAPPLACGAGKSDRIDL
jgi:hypothetical protein